MIPGFQRNSTFRLGMVVALPSEAKALLGRCQWTQSDELAQCSWAGPAGAHTLFVRCGMGSERAARAASFLLDQGVTHIGIAGVSGGLDSGLNSGQLVLANEVVDEDGKCWPVASAFRRALAGCIGNDVHDGRILTTEAPLLTAAQKALWSKRSNAVAVDMESAAVARVAAASGLPFFAMRAICDEATRSVPPELFDLVDDLGRPRPGKLIGLLLQQPSLVPALLRMQRDFGRALRALRYGWQAFGDLKLKNFFEGEDQG